jgi:diguanylate cyclase (GGDEF)-like protein
MSRSTRRRMTIGRRLFYTHLLVAILVAGSLGAYLHMAAESELREALANRIAENAQLAAQALTNSGWDSIDQPGDMDEEPYRALSAKLSAIATSNPGISRLMVFRSAEESAVIADSFGATSGYAPGDRLSGFGQAIAGSPSGLTHNSPLAAFNAVVAIPGAAGYGLALNIPTQDISDKLHQLRANSAVSFVLAVALALAMSLWLASSARGILRRFATRFRDIAEGKLAQRFEVRADDEFSELAVALDDMSARIDNSQREREQALVDLKTARDKLEDMVRQRSIELDKLNVMLRNEIEQRCQLEAALAEAAATDSMTRLLNRRGMIEALDQAVEQAKRLKSAFIIVIVDVDHFKRINDQHGHSVGDQVLIALGRRLKNSLGHLDAAARWGGEEFLLLWPRITITEAEQRANALRQVLAEVPIYPGGPQITLSMGVAEFTGLDNLDRCINRADKALYRAKQEGRNRVMVGI